MKASFQIFKAPFYFVGWLAPAYRDRRSQSQRDHKKEDPLGVFFFDDQPVAGLGMDEVNPCGITPFPLIF